MAPGIWRTSARAANLSVVRLHLWVAGLHPGLRGKSGDPAAFESNVYGYICCIPHPKRGQHPDSPPQKKEECFHHPGICRLHVSTIIRATGGDSPPLMAWLRLQSCVGLHVSALAGCSRRVIPCTVLLVLRVLWNLWEELYTQHLLI